MKVLIEDIKKLVASDLEDKDKYLEMLIKDYIKEQETLVSNPHGLQIIDTMNMNNKAASLIGFNPLNK